MGDVIEVQDIPCTWTVRTFNGAPGTWSFSPQITAPLPLEDLNNVIAKSVAGQDSPLLGNTKSRNCVSVTKDFFQSRPNGIDGSSLGEGVMGFFSMLISSAKAATALDEEEGLKHLLPIMPRTDYVGLKKQVTLPAGDLYNLLTILACYANGASR